MFGAQRNVGRFILGEDEHLLSAGDLGGALHHDPVLGAVVVQLQRQRGARFHRQALDLVAGAGVDAFVVAPGAEHATVELVLVAAEGLQLGDDFLHVLGAFATRDQHGVGGFDDHHAVQADGGDAAVLGQHQGVAHLVGEDVALGDVAMGIARGDVPQRGPGADVGPASVEGHHGGLVGLLHDGVVDGVAGRGQEGGLVHAAEVHVALALGDGGLAGREDGRRVALHLGDPGIGAQGEDAAVPVVFAGLHVALGGGEVGLFDEPADLVGRAAREGVAAPDVAVAGLGMARHDAVGDQVAGIGEGDALLHRGLEDGLVGDDVIGGHDHHHRVGILFEQVQGGDGERRCGVASFGFEQDGAGLEADALDLLGHQEAMFLVADEHRGPGMGQLGEAQGGFLQQGAVAEQGQQGLGIMLAGQGPQSAACPTGEDHGMNGHGLPQLLEFIALSMCYGANPNYTASPGK